MMRLIPTNTFIFIFVVSSFKIYLKNKRTFSFKRGYKNTLNNSRSYDYVPLPFLGLLYRPLPFSGQRYSTWNQRYWPLLTVTIVTESYRYLRYKRKRYCFEQIFKIYKKIYVTLLTLVTQVTVTFGNGVERSVTVSNGGRRWVTVTGR